MTTNDDEMFARAGRLLAKQSPSETARAAERARVIQGMVATERRHMRRRSARRRVAFRAAGGCALAASVLLIAHATVPGGVIGTVRSDAGILVSFTFDGASATRVAVVGEFNAWDARSHPMTRSSDGRWRVELPVLPGRHTYAFVVNDSTWTADPDAPRAPERWYGDPRSVLVVGEK
jgi:hypothetical protein